MKSITMVDDALSEREIARAVTTAFDYLRPEERVMSNLYKSCFSPTGNMRRELFRWVNPDQYGKIFNASNDSLDLHSKRFIAFDFTHIFEDETLAPAVISYIMHRIQSETGETGVPSLIMIDETAPMLKHPMFRDYFIIGLQEGRKNVRHTFALSNSRTLSTGWVWVKLSAVSARRLFSSATRRRWPKIMSTGTSISVKSTSYSAVRTAISRMRFCCRVRQPENRLFWMLIWAASDPI